MKTIEEKYQEMKKRVLEIGRGYVKEEVDYSKPRSIAEYIDPELKETEDDRIRNFLISKMKEVGNVWKEYSAKDIIAWLEKQKISEATTKNVYKMVAEFADTKEECTNGKPVNCQIRSYKQGITDAIRVFGFDREKGKTEPKFHEGEWLIDKEDNTIFTITKVLEHTYKYVTNTGKEYSCTHYSLEQDARPWDYNDAKDGDVLVDKYNNIGIFQKRAGKCWHSHIYLGCDGEIRGFGTGGNHIQTDTHPATKEQSELLFTKMKEAGYKCDAEKKELKNIEQKPVWNREDEQNLNAALGYIDDEYLRRWLKDVIYNKYENPSEWSEEDEKRLDDVTKAVNHLLLENDPWLYHENIYLEDCPVWLKSLKERVQSQPKQEWSEEDEKMRIKILEALSAYADHKQNTGFCIDAELIRGELVTWLKSLKGRVQSQLKRVLNRVGIINEMAVPLKAYKTRLDELRFQLVENWCLCKWCQLFNPECENFAHWITELKACIDNLKFVDIKNGIDKRRILTRMLVNNYDYNNVNMIERIVRGKFVRENISDNNQKVRVCTEFADNINGLIDAISLDAIDSDEYIQNTFSNDSDVVTGKIIVSQNTWKPSDEQMEILQYLCETSSHPNKKVIPTLESLLSDLKKLREE